MIKFVLPVLIGGSVGLVGCSSTNSVSKVTVPVVADQSQLLVNELKKGLSLYFGNNSATVEDKYDIYLTVASQFLKKDMGYVLVLQGFTDSSGGSATNKRISLERANAVRNQMIREYGANPSQIIASGLGSAQPIASNATSEGRAKNRRVTATLRLR